ncbi:hypothetical protein, partial [uncultured Nevskia sp.]|uniref:hypothetical protein n=1 Tax=uncultured Nevskia sp. TaxID=228950 RepID=UPI0025E3AE21
MLSLREIVMIRPYVSFLSASAALGFALALALVAPSLSASGAIPDAFSLVPRRDATPGSEQISEPVTIYGLDAVATANVDLGSLSINGGPFSTALNEVRSGDVL